MITLRPDQELLTVKLRQSIRSGHRAPLVVAPTAFGKTYWFTSIARAAIAKQKRVIILSHRTELIDQISEALTAFDVPHGFIAAGYAYDPFQSVHVASVFTLVKRLARIVPPHMFIIDEAHHATGKSTWGKIVSVFPNTFRIGVTATPIRTSGEGLAGLFDDLILGPTVRELIDNGTLSDYKLFAPLGIDLTDVRSSHGDYVQSDLSAKLDKPKIIGDAVAEYKKFAFTKQAVTFCVSVEHAYHTGAAFREAGFMATSIDGTMERHERRRLVDDFRRGTLRVLTSCDLFNEGFDVKGIECGIFLRPTQSLGLWLQQLGRCLRSMPGKTHALLLDHANNALAHGLPDMEREWSLEGIERGKGKKKQEVPIRQCMKCYAVMPAAVKVCAECGHAFDVQYREVAQEAGELQELNMEAMQRLFGARAKKVEVAQAQDYDSLLRIEKERGYKPGWARHIANARDSKLRRQADQFRPEEKR